MRLNETQILEAEIDENNVFRNVLLLAPTSRNGRTYSPSAIEKAQHLYENAPVYLDHSTKSRSYSDRIGVVQNPRYENGHLRGDIIVNPKHPMSEAVLWDAQNKTAKVGMSHSIEGTLNKKSNLVEEISKVWSVDIVSDPATTSNFFEQSEQADNELSELKQLNESLQKQLEELQTQIKQTQNKVKPVTAIPEAPKVENGFGDWLKRIKRETR